MARLLPRASGGGATDAAHGPIREALAERAYASVDAAAPTSAAAAAASGDVSAKQGAVSRLVQVYSNRGHLLADIDPLGLMRPAGARGAGARRTSA